MANMKQKKVSIDHRTRCKGFTLLEVLVALTIVALSLGALISTSGSQATSAAYLKQKTIAHWVAMNEITQLQIEKAWLSKGDTKGSTQMAGTEWFWTRTVKETEDDNSRQVELKIYLDEDREYSLTRLVAYLSRDSSSTAPQL